MPIRYLTTDLDLSTPVDLQPLVGEFESRGLYTLHPDHLRRDNGWFAIFGTSESHADPESNISAMLDAIEASSPGVKAIWDAGTQREFNIGYDSGDEPWAFNQGLSTSTLRRMAEVGATLRITIYPPDRDRDLDER